MGLPAQVAVDHPFLGARGGRLAVEPPTGDAHRADAGADGELAFRVDLDLEFLQDERRVRAAAEGQHFDIRRHCPRTESEAGPQLPTAEVVALLDEANGAWEPADRIPIELEVTGDRIRRAREALDLVARPDARQAVHDADTLEQGYRPAAQADQPVDEIGRNRVGPIGAYRLWAEG